ncbi:MAG: alpha/beta hydrolase [Candidatus Limnocylindrales bacterium]
MTVHASAVEDRMIQTRLGSLAVRLLGDGPPAILWHSLFVDERSWRRVEDGLARERRLVVITGPGHGRSNDPGHRYSLDDCAAAAGEVLDVLDVRDPVDWVGNAWGGHVGIVFAASWPDRCRTLATFGTPILAYGRAARLQLRVLLAVYRIVGMVGFLSSGICDVLLSPRTRSSDPEAVALVLDGLRTRDRRGLANAMLSISLGRPDLTPRLSAIRCPTVFATGDAHAEWTPGQAEDKVRLLARGSAKAVPDTAYLTPLEAPEATIRIVQDLWARPDWSPPALPEDQLLQRVPKVGSSSARESASGAPPSAMTA